MKIIFLAVLWASVCCVVIPVDGQTASKNTKASKAKPADSQPPKVEAVNVDTVNVTKLSIQQQEKSAGKPDSNKEESDSYFHRFIAPENLPNLLLCLVGIAGVIITVLTLSQIRNQTGILADYNKATRDIANIARSTLTATQRPKIAVKRVSVIPRDNDYWQIACVIANTGGSKAEIIDSDVTILKLEVGTVQELLPSLPPYSKKYSFGRFCLDAGERQEKSVVLDKQGDATVMNDTKLMMMWYAIATGGLQMRNSPIICFGYLHYRDESGVSRRTGFGAVWDAESMGFTWLESPDYQYTD